MSICDRHNIQTHGLKNITRRKAQKQKHTNTPFVSISSFYITNLNHGSVNRRS